MYEIEHQSGPFNFSSIFPLKSYLPAWFWCSFCTAYHSMPEESGDIRSPRKIAALSAKSPMELDYRNTYNIWVPYKMKISNFRVLRWLFKSVQVTSRGNPQKLRGWGEHQKRIPKSGLRGWAHALKAVMVFELCWLLAPIPDYMHHAIFLPSTRST